MAALASSALLISPFSTSFTAVSRKSYKPFLSHPVLSFRPFSLQASFTSSAYSSSATVADKPSIPLKSNSWKWKFEDKSISIYYEEHLKDTSDSPKDILMIPTISDVSTVEEWRSAAVDIVQRVGGINWRATIVDWPGLGYSDRPKMDYNADVMENFLVDFINAPDSPLRNSDT